MFYITSSDLINLCFLNFLLYIRVHVINNVGQFQVYNSDSVIHIHVFIILFKFFSQLGCYRILTRVLCAIQ